jgi:hypothetical protein
MPVAGSNVEVFHLLVNNGRLVNLGKHRYPSHLAEDRLDVAAKMLMTGKTVFLQALGTNLAEVKAALKDKGVRV